MLWTKGRCWLGLLGLLAAFFSVAGRLSNSSGLGGDDPRRHVLLGCFNREPIAVISLLVIIVDLPLQWPIVCVDPATRPPLEFWRVLWLFEVLTPPSPV